MAGIAGDDALGEIGLGGRGSAEAGGVAGCALDGFDHGRKGVAQNHGTPGAEVVDVAIAVGVEEIRALGAVDKRRIAAHGAKGTHGRVDAAGKVTLGALLEGLGTGAYREGHALSILEAISSFLCRANPAVAMRISPRMVTRSHNSAVFAAVMGAALLWAPALAWNQSGGGSAGAGGSGGSGGGSQSNSGQNGSSNHGQNGQGQGQNNQNGTKNGSGSGTNGNGNTSGSSSGGGGAQGKQPITNSTSLGQAGNGQNSQDQNNGRNGASQSNRGQNNGRRNDNRALNYKESRNNSPALNRSRAKPAAGHVRNSHARSNASKNYGSQASPSPNHPAQPGSGQRSGSPTNPSNDDRANPSHATPAQNAHAQPPGNNGAPTKGSRGQTPANNQARTNPPQSNGSRAGASRNGNATGSSSQGTGNGSNPGAQPNTPQLPTPQSGSAPPH